MADNIPSSPAGVPGVPAGNPPAQTMAREPKPLENGGPGGGAAPKLPFGGNVGRKARADGFKPGSPEAIAADRDRDARRKRDERAAKAAATPPPPLPPSAESVPATLANAPLAPGGNVSDPLADPLLQWAPADFSDCAPELLELVEGWRVDVRTQQAVEGRLPRKLVQEIAADAAFPKNAKQSLSRTSPATLADLFNALNVPVKLKKYVVSAPLILYLAVRDIACGARINKLIAEEDERRKAEAAATPVK